MSLEPIRKLPQTERKRPTLVITITSNYHQIQNWPSFPTFRYIWFATLDLLRRAKLQQQQSTEGDSMSFHFFVPKSPFNQLGQFEGTVQCKWLDIDHPESEANKPERKVQMLQTFAYQDPEGYQWVVPKDKIVDGASIPKLFWKVVGSPYVGNYRRASVIHDYFCCIPEQHQKTAKEVHQMFYFACRAGNTSPLKAALMYWAVYWFGPHWKEGQRYPSLAYYYLTSPWQILQHQLNRPKQNTQPQDPGEVIQR